MSSLRFEWDEAKNAANKRKHGVSFELASQVFDDPLYLSAPERIEGGEERWQTFGLVNSVLLLLVAHTVREDDAPEPIEIIRIITARKATPRERRDMKTKIVRYTSEPLPRLTAADRRRLKALAVLPDSEIDLSDAPELTDEQWKHVVRGRFYRPIKQQITARVDADVLAWLKAQGNGYQSRINAILRREMLHAMKAGKGAA